jgi:hypothetical protein
MPAIRTGWWAGRTQIEPGEKKNKARLEIETFLGHLPPEFEGLREIFKQALDLLGRPEPDENKLEELDEEIDRRLFELAPEEEKQANLKEVQRDFPGKPASFLVEIQQTRLIKARRQASQIPYISLFYY